MSNATRISFDFAQSASSHRTGWASVLAALLLGAPANRLCQPTPTLRQAFSARYLKWRFPLAYALWRELRSLPYRIAEIHERSLSENGLHLGAEIEILPSGVRRRDADAQNRIQPGSSMFKFSLRIVPDRTHWCMRTDHNAGKGFQDVGTRSSQRANQVFFSEIVVLGSYDRSGS